MKLHIGCGTVYLDGYVNLDCKPDYFADKCDASVLEANRTTYDRYYKQDFGTLPGHVVVDVEHDIFAWPLPFPDDSMDEVVMYQVLEHMPDYARGCILDNIAQVIRPGGVFLVSVPDVKQTARMLAEARTDKDEDWAIRLIHGTQRNAWCHHWCGYTPRTLRSFLSEHGFGSFADLPSINFYPVVHIKAVKL
jgi:SAM-dependent methyltransferase